MMTEPAQPVYPSRPVLLLAEAVFPFFTEAQVRRLLLKLCDRFAGAELVFDGWKPIEIWLGNRLLARSAFSGLMRWGVCYGADFPGMRNMPGECDIVCCRVFGRGGN